MGLVIEQTPLPQNFTIGGGGGVREHKINKEWQEHQKY